MYPPPARSEEGSVCTDQPPLTLSLSLSLSLLPVPAVEVTWFEALNFFSVVVVVVVVCKCVFGATNKIGADMIEHAGMAGHVISMFFELYKALWRFSRSCTSGMALKRTCGQNLIMISGMDFEEGLSLVGAC